jgi:hypothetical protein
MTKWLYMRRIATCLNTAQYKTFSKKAEELGISEYELTKQAVLQVITQPTETTKAKLAILKAIKEAYKILGNAP